MMSNRYVWARFDVDRKDVWVPQSSRVITISGTSPEIWGGNAFSGNTLVGQDKHLLASGAGVHKISGDYNYQFNTEANPVVYAKLRHSGSLTREYEITVTVSSGRSSFDCGDNWQQLEERDSVNEKGDRDGTVSNSASSTYPPNDTQPRIASICVIPAILRRCKYVE